MGLPLILDVALGLIFIYLILSLLASEIQELIATVLQWRADHLRKSIEILLAGDAEASENSQVIQLTNKIYNNPLIQSINQESKGLISTLPRKITWALASFFKNFRKSDSRFKKETIFGDQKHSAPSYIGSKTFADTFMDTLKLPIVVKKLTEMRLENFKEERLNQIRQILLQLQIYINEQTISSEFTKIIAAEFCQLELEYNNITNDFCRDKYNIRMTVQRMISSLDKYIQNFQIMMPGNEYILDKPLRELQFMKQDIFANVETAIIIGGLNPNINDIVQTFKQGTEINQKIINSIQDKDSEIYKQVHEIIQSLPDSVVSSIETMAKRAQMRAQSVEEGMYLLRQEIEQTFDSSMERAGGVYKRNAKGVAILIGITLAVSTNTDTFNIVNRLSKDSLLRTAIVYKAAEISPQSSNNLDPKNIDKNQLLKDVYLPIGWGENNLKHQLSSENDSHPKKITSILTMIAGWAVSGLAIAMGAPFWFELLGKVMNVRNAGKKSTTAKQDS
ncbi:hypothetical protein H6F32_11340 [Anabaena sp. FACHB-1237]|uniref:hypothetical protein n=1 Tax=Anabaena sp. FACHB-1237 TaxID=2692769 RepID=UPI001681914B|nr:hypothetical protein [Anabaena sp. FACHB-1237]MBD2138168.1 hypothetical protein [Anabaena sp. FACHB-1237]